MLHIPSSPREGVLSGGETGTLDMEANAGQAGLVIACGGTGGHLFPGLAVAEAWVARGGRVLLLVSEKKIDQEASRKYSGYRFETIPAAAKPATLSPKMLPFLWSLWRTMGRCGELLEDFGADAVLGMGGFTSLPPVYAGKKRGLATFIHDSNALPGKANRLTSRWCREVFIGMEAARGHFSGVECVVTGTPVRDELRKLPSRQQAAAKFGLDPARSTVLVMGGSQGARNLNSMVAAADFAEGLQILHIAGPGDESRVCQQVAERGGYKVLGFCDDMASAYAVADGVVARAGASSLTELAFLGLPSLLVPYPHAADDHQTRNAEVFAQAGAAILAQEVDLDSAGLVRRVSEMLEQREAMASAARALAVPDAADRVCNAIESTLR